MNEIERTTLQQAFHELTYASIFGTVSGAHLYGFASPDSDFDLRGSHVLPLTAVIGLGKPRETETREFEQAGREIDLVTHDVKKFITLMLNRNGYVMEQLYSPLVVQGGEAFEELQTLGRGCITRHIHHHYLGFCRRQIKRFEAESPKQVKTLLYIYRVLMTGIWVLETGQIESNLPRLNEVFRLPFIPDLIAQKGTEKAILTDMDPDTHQAAIAGLQEQLETAYQESSLPEEPTNRPALNDFLVRVRLDTSNG